MRLSAACILAGAGFLASDSSLPDSAPTRPALGLKAAQCHFEAAPDLPPHDCLEMVVPENPDDAASARVTFPLVRFQAERPFGSLPQPPVLHLGGGGPGAAMISGTYVDIATLLNAYAPLSLNMGMDLIIVDPRGSGASRPSLNCPEIAEGFAAVMQLPDTAAQLRQLNTLSHRCYRRLRKQGIRLEDYRSLRIAQDIEALRKALDIDRWHLYGISYGTRYALTLIREVPDTVASAVLDSPVFSGVNYGERAATDFHAAFRQVFDRCDNVPACNRQFPRLSDRFWKLIAHLNTQALKQEMHDPDTSDRLPFTLTGDTLLNILFINLYAPGFADAFPALIDALESGDYRPLTALAEHWYLFMTDVDFSDGSYNSHVCADEAAFVDGEVLARSYKDLPPPLREIMQRTHETTLQFCRDVWPVKPSGDPYVLKAINTSTPVLILQGALDPAVNAAYLKEQYPHYTHAFWQVYPNAAHDVVGSEAEAARAAGCFFATGQPCVTVK